MAGSATGTTRGDRSACLGHLWETHTARQHHPAASPDALLLSEMIPPRGLVGWDPHPTPGQGNPSFCLLIKLRHTESGSEVTGQADSGAQLQGPSTWPWALGDTDPMPAGPWALTDRVSKGRPGERDVPSEAAAAVAGVCEAGGTACVWSVPDPAATRLGFLPQPCGPKEVRVPGAPHPGSFPIILPPRGMPQLLTAGPPWPGLQASAGDPEWEGARPFSKSRQDPLPASA